MPNQSKFFALLIGIDRYSQTPLEDGSFYPNLGGCVRDVELVEEMLRSRGIESLSVVKLASRISLTETDSLPTYRNIVESFKSIISDAQRGDQVYIHYSGHGGRTLTIFPDAKGEKGLDESLVPCDIGDNGPCFLRDVEIAYLMHEMEEKGLVVTMALDSCHSGGATRGRLTGSTVRGTGHIYAGSQVRESLVGPLDDLAENFSRRKLKNTRSVIAEGGWAAIVPKDFVLLAACRADELANEFSFDGIDRNGALTYWMLDGLRQLNCKATFNMLFRYLGPKIHSRFLDQSPQIEGDGDREIFGTNTRSGSTSLTVSSINIDEGMVEIAAGSSQGIRVGAAFSIFANEAVELITSNRVAIAEAVEVSGFTTTAKILMGGDIAGCEAGMQAVYLGPALELRSKVVLAKSGLGIQQTTAMNQIHHLLSDSSTSEISSSWIALVEDGSGADFQVRIDEQFQFEILDSGGSKLPYISSASTSDPMAPKQIISRLVHLAKFRNVQQIDNTDPNSPLTRGITAVLGTLFLKSPVTTNPAEKVFAPLSADRKFLSDGELFCVRVTNNTEKAVNFAIFDLRPNWSIVQISPVGKKTEILESGAFLDVQLKAKLTPGLKESTETIKVFAASEDTDFRWLALPSLDDVPSSARSVSRSPTNSLEKLFAAFSAENPTRDVINLSAEGGQSWTVAEVEIRIRRETIAHFSDPALSLLQSAFDETIAKKTGERTRVSRGEAVKVLRPESNNSIVQDISLACAQSEFGDGQRGVLDVPKYCAGLAVGIAREWFNAKIWNDNAKYLQYKDEITQKFGTCDPNYREALLQFLEFLKNNGQIPYRQSVRSDDFVINNRLDVNAVIGVVADWATGEPEALEVLRQVKEHNPSIAAHLGDIYYAGTEFEVENYFYKPWTEILGADVLSFALPGNHDLYAGGRAFYAMIDKLAQFNRLDQPVASHFCLRNKHWQIIGLDTALRDRLIGPTTRLEDSEAAWLDEKMKSWEGKKTILMSHHQLFSANDQFDGKSFNRELFDQVKSFLPRVNLWLWGHEHDLVLFDPFMGLERGRCIGGSAYPVGNFEMPLSQKNADVTFNKEIALTKGKSFYHHCYVIIRLEGEVAHIEYYEDRHGGTLVGSERI